MPVAQAIAGCPLSCVVVNVNGMRNKTKRRTLFQRLRTLRCCIIILCETHSRDDAETTAWTQEGAGPGLPWEGHAFWHHGTSQSRGVAVLISAGLPISTPKVIHMDPAARVLLVSFNSNEGGPPWAVMGVYAPAEPAHRPAFFQGPFATACSHLPPGSAKLVAGDWNCVTSLADFSTPHAHPNQNSRLVGAQELAAVQTTHGLVDVWRHLHPHDVDFTRTTHSAATATYGRTSRWLISQEFLDELWETSCAHMPGQLPGDHAAVSLHLSPPDQPLLGPGAWTLPTYLLGVPEYEDRMSELIQDLCRHPPAGLNPVEFWDHLKASVKAETRLFCAERRQRLNRERRDLLSSVYHSKQAYLQHPTSLPHAQAFQAAVQALQQHDQQQVVDRGPTLDALWESYGEQGTMWFHRLGREPCSNQPFRCVKDPSGQPPANLRSMPGVNKAGDLLADFFDGSLPSGLFHPAQVDTAAQDQLLQSVDKSLGVDAQTACLGPQPDGRLTEECVKAALASAPKGKRPGCDGLPYEFYTRFWSLLSEPMVAAFNEVFFSAAATPELSLCSRTGLIVLLHKGGDKPWDDPDSYRPITLLNCDLKLVAKVMVLRLGEPLDGVIDATQSAFVPGRWIGDNVLFHLEEVDYVAQQQLSACIVGIDYNKAYDRVHRGWLQRCMEALGLPAPAQRWINILLQGSRAQIVFNGFSSRTFPVLAGCAQGSPLSPLLYVISAQPLAARCRQLQRTGLVDVIPLPDGTPAPPMHQHADDTTIHTCTIAGAQQVLQQAIKPFCQASGAQVSLPKSWGLSLGTHPPLVGLHAGTGITFKSPLEPVRHLGIPLTTGDQAAAVSTLYGKKLQAVCARIRHWSRHKLSYLGRLHVAKQVLASTLSYHATFLAPPEQQLASISRAIQGYIISGGLLDEADTRPLRHRPSRHVASLPRDQGGVSLVDLEAFGHALRAKVPAMLLHPKRCHWKPLMAAAFEVACPGIGVGLLVQQTRCYGTAAPNRNLSPRHASYVQSLQQLGLHRRVVHSNLTKEQIGLELLVGNHSVAGADGLAFKTPAHMPPNMRPLARLGQVPVASWPLLKLPVDWAATANTPSTCRWEVDGAQEWVRLTLPTGTQWWFQVCSDGQIQRLSIGPAVVPTTWSPACVLDAPPVKDPTRDMQYLAGPWDSVKVDPSVWTLGTEPLLLYSVRHTTARIIQWQCRDAPGWVPGAGVRPKLWGTGLAGAGAGVVSEMAARQKRRFDDALQAPGSSGQGRPIRESDLAPLYQASWFLPSPPRLHVRQRVEGREALATQQREQQQAHEAAILFPLVDDTMDPLRQAGAAPAAAPPWSKAWTRAQLKRLPRESKAFAWLLLHAALPCGGSKVSHYPPGHPGLREAGCWAPCCARASPRPLETLEHLFLECPVGKQALEWLCGLWQLIDTGPAPLFMASVLLADDASVWRPSPAPAGLQPLWTILRITMLKRVWLARQACVLGGDSAGFTAARVVAAFVAEISCLIRQDGLRVKGDIRQAGGVCPSWFRGRTAGLPKEDFKRWWCVHSVLATMPEDAQGCPQPTVELRADTLPNFQFT